MQQQCDPQQATNFIKQLVRSFDFEDVGVASIDEVTPYGDQFIKAIENGRHGPLDYLEKTKEKRSDIKILMPEARSVVMFVKNYYVGDHADFFDGIKIPPRKFPPSKKGGQGGFNVSANSEIPLNPPFSKGEIAKVARYAWGKDYHYWFKKRLRKIRRAIHEKFGNETKVYGFNDTSPVLERAWAERAGLGFIGKSAMFIHRKYGTWTFLAGFATDLELVADKQIQKPSCGSCTACIDACPTKAIIAEKTVDARRCLSTYNIERPLDQNANNPLFQGLGWAFGCDICQEVCPWNKFEQPTSDEKFQPIKNHIVLSNDSDLSDIKGTPLARAGETCLIKNISRAVKSF